MMRKRLSSPIVAALTFAVALVALGGQARALSLSNLLGGDSESVPGLNLIRAGDLSAMLARHIAISVPQVVRDHLRSEKVGKSIPFRFRTASQIT